MKVNNKSEFVRFKNLLEYFVAHLEYISNQNSMGRGYERYIKPLVDNGNFKTSGQGWNGAAIQQQVQSWDTYPDGKICINIQSNYGSYASVKCYLNWQDTGINILASWNNGEIVGLYQDEFIYWEKPTRRTNTGKVYTIEMLKLFEGEIITEHLKDFFHSFISKYEVLKKNEIIKEQMKTVNKFKEVLEHKKQIILQGPPGTGKTRQAKLIAKEMLRLESVDDLADNTQFKLVQLHPSYTYEDFVRGIVSKPNPEGDGIVYEAENKTLAAFAEAALANYKNATQKSPISPVSDVFEAFIEYVKDEMALDVNHKYPITDAVYLFAADETRFKYKGDNWVAHQKGLNMKFSELKQIIEADIRERQEIKKMTALEELTRQHATYFLKVAERFYEFKANYKVADNKSESTQLKNYVLIIDEINRANLSSVLGELIYALEYRNEPVESMYEVDGSAQLVLPPNLYIIGTMNTADRSVGHIDYAIRRRFAFVDVLPEELEDNEEIYFNKNDFQLVASLFTDQNISPEFEINAVQIGHSYFIVKKSEAQNEEERDKLFDLKMQYEVLPILEEYVQDGILLGKVGEQPILDYIRSLKKQV
ncbi:AAA family ATPase [Chryseobacterium salipaludis]|uniref:AAA family ATPase n=1 Tax=Chryseobacterium TaxID=59732 RepID=UPI001FF4C796|nr:MULTISPECIES: AAA family ATPase [Chryseobacterium]MCJ8498047.1 AAA family ATPase [Chryseobacterium salipaludis]MCX3296754.1 AAA family ATPase [Planobacterium sp. JC490]